MPARVAAMAVVDRLLQSDEPSIRWKTRAVVLGEDPGSAPMRAAQEEIKDSPRVRALLRRHRQPGRVQGPPIYAKWQGAHWALPRTRRSRLSGR